MDEGSQSADTRDAKGKKKRTIEEIVKGVYREIETPRPSREFHKAVSL